VETRIYLLFKIFILKINLNIPSSDLKAFNTAKRKCMACIFMSYRNSHILLHDVWHSTVTNVFFICLPPSLRTYACTIKVVENDLRKAPFYLKGDCECTQYYYYDVDCVLEREREDKNNIFRRLIKFYRAHHKNVLWKTILPATVSISFFHCMIYWALKAIKNARRIGNVKNE
jgi:hypothetical protein